jgi:hypothetical protein
VVVSFIEVEDCRDGNIHAFEIMSVEWWHDQKIDVFSQVQECRSNK